MNTRQFSAKIQRAKPLKAAQPSWLKSVPEAFKLGDNSPCPVNGKHRGRPMKDVPASFLFWLEEQPWCAKKYPMVAVYINDHRKWLEKEANDEQDFDVRDTF